MYRAQWVCMLGLLAGGSLLIAQDEGKLQSGPKVGAFMPKPFECFNVNGPAKATYVEPKKGEKEDPGYFVPRPHCLICKFALSPAVLIFAKEPAEGKDEVFTDLLAKLDETAADFDEVNFQVGVVILSPDARDSTNNVQEVNAEEIIKEAVKRDQLIERLKKRTAKLKNVVVCAHPAEGPKGYQLNPKAEVTVLFYERMKVIENFAFEPGAMDAKGAKVVLNAIRLRELFGIELNEDKKQVKVRSAPVNSAAAKAGLKVGDEILEVEGKEIKSVVEALENVVELKGGSSLTLVVGRQDAKHKIEMKAKLLR